MRADFYLNRDALDAQFVSPLWIEESGIEHDELEDEIFALEAKMDKVPKTLVKARTFELICEKAMIAIDKDDIFQDKLNGTKIMAKQRSRWQDAVTDRLFAEERVEMRTAWKDGAYRGVADYGHITPNTRLLLEVGFSGLLERVELASARDGLSDKQKDFYESCRTVLSSMIGVAKRLSDAIRPYNEENADALLNITRRAPENTYEAMQLIVLYFFLHEYIGGARVRTLGRLDLMLCPFYKNDIEKGTYTREEIEEMMRFFLNKFWSAKVPYDLPFCIGGCDGDGNDVVNEISYMIVNIYNELNIYSPKIHVRICDKTPKEFTKLILSCIRGGNSSFVFVNDNVAMKGLIDVGIERADAFDYVPVGCYEPAVWGVEVGCSDNGGINLVKALELVFTNGYDLASTNRYGLSLGECGKDIVTFEDVVAALKKQVEYIVGHCLDYVASLEGHFCDIYPDSIFSSMNERSVESGIDLYEGSAKYNNGSFYFYGTATIVDALCAIKKLVFEDKRVSLAELCEILKNDWQGSEKLRAVALRIKEKYGNSNALADELTVDITDFCASLVNNKPNGRGGVFKAAMFTIDECFYLGKRTMATPDGRRAGDSLSKNLCATVGMDRNGITSLINSVTKIDHSKFPNGSVLDFVLHPSAVAGEDGLEAFLGILMTYMKKGGFAMHGNVFDAETLKKAQKDPEKYKNLQVRVCGWNAYFVNLSIDEQNAFIKQAEGAL